MLADSRTWKMQGMDHPLGPPEGTSPPFALILTP